MAAVACAVKGVFMAVNESGAAPTVVLDAGERGSIPIYIGIWEALAIYNQLFSKVVPRPMTHDLMREIIARFDITVTRLQIDAIEDGVYYAQLYLKNRDHDGVVDCRPSDGIALALRSDAPILVDEDVISSAAHPWEDLPEMVDLQSYF
ncbi:MAG: bifunctional nuclease family protein [Methanomicrobiales archaeon]